MGDALLETIARGPPRVDFSPLGDLFSSYQKGVQASREDEAYNALKNLTPKYSADGKPDYAATSFDLLKSGNGAAAKTLADLHEKGETAKLGWAQLAQNKTAQEASNAIQRGQLGLQGQQFANTVATQQPDYIQRAAEARLAAEEKFKPQTIDIKGTGPLGEATTTTMQRGPGGIAPLQIQGQPQGAPGTAAPAPQGALTGQEYLDSLPPNIAARVKGIVEGREAPPPGGSRAPQAQALLNAAAQYEPGFDFTQWGARHSSAKDFSAGKSAEMVRSANQTIHHVGELVGSMDRLNNSQFPMYNAVGNTINTNLGKSAVTEFQPNAHAVAEELSKVFKGANMSDAEIHQWEASLSPNMSPEQQRASVGKLMQLLNGSLSALEEKRARGMGQAASEKAPPLLGEDAQKTLAAISGWLSGQPAPKPAMPGGYRKPATREEANAAMRGQPGAAPPAPPQGPQGLPQIRTQADLQAAVEQARQAVAAGADPAAVTQRLRAMGYQGGF